MRRRLRFGACSSAVHATRSACGYASPVRVTGDTKVVSTAACAPCQMGKPFAKTSMRRPSVKGTSTFMSRKRTLVATRAPASRHTRAALSNAAPRVPSTPAVGQAARWSPRASRSPPQRHRQNSEPWARRLRHVSHLGLLTNSTLSKLQKLIVHTVPPESQRPETATTCFQIHMFVQQALPM